MIVPIRVFSLLGLADSADGRYALSGIRLQRVTDGVARATACDGKVLATAQWRSQRTLATRMRYFRGLAPRRR